MKEIGKDLNGEDGEKMDVKKEADRQTTHGQTFPSETSADKKMPPPSSHSYEFFSVLFFFFFQTAAEEEVEEATEKDIQRKISGSYPRTRVPLPVPSWRSELISGWRILTLP